MSTTKFLRTAIAIAAFSALAASPALAQGNGKAKGKARGGQESARVERERPTLQRRGEDAAVQRPRSGDRYEDAEARDRRRDDGAVLRPRSGDRYEDPQARDRRNDARWEDVLLGRTDQRRRNVPPGWCKGRGNPHNTPENCGYASDRRYDWDSDDRYGGYGSFGDAHTAFHRALDREYAARAAERRTDPLYQLRLRAEKAADHDRWHERTGTRH